MSYFAFRKGKSCMLGTFDMSANGGNGPSSMILCFPILPSAASQSRRPDRLMSLP